MHLDMEIAARKFIAGEFSEYPMSIDNVEFTPPADGGMWLKYSYIPAVTRPVSLDRSCMVYVGMVQVDVYFAPNTGTQKAKKLADAVAKAAKDGILIDEFYIYECGRVSQAHKTCSGWFIPVRFSIRVDKRED